MDGVYQLTTFGTKHLGYMAATGMWFAVTLSFGVFTKSPDTRRRIVWALVLLSVGQELVYDAISLSAGAWMASRDLPLHLCSMAMLVSAWALATRRQLAFEVAYFWGIIAASQAMLTPDTTRWQLGELDAAWNFLSHGVIVLNVGWLVLIEGMRLRRGAWLRVFLVTNGTAAVVGVVDWLTGWNYFFLREKPGGDSPFLVGEWPWYLLVLEVLALVFCFVVELPMRKREEAPGNESPEASALRAA